MRGHEIKKFEASERIGLILIGFCTNDVLNASIDNKFGIVLNSGEFNGTRAVVVLIFISLVILSLFWQRVWEPIFWKIWRLANRHWIYGLKPGAAWRYIKIKGLRGLFYTLLGMALYVLSLIYCLFFIGERQAFLLLIAYIFIFVQIGMDHDLERYSKSGVFPGFVKFRTERRIRVKSSR